MSAIIFHLTKKVKTGFMNKAINKRILVPAIVFSILFSLSFVIGSAMQHTNTITALILPKAFLNFVLIFTVCLVASYLIFVFVFSHPIGKDSCVKIRYFPVLLILLLCWLPCFLSYYPGIASYDIYEQTEQAIGISQYSLRQPPLHTFLWQLCLKIQEFSGIEALLLLSTISNVFLAASLAKLTVSIYERFNSTLFAVVSLIFFALVPNVQIMAEVAAKDSFLAASIALLFSEIITKKRKPVLCIYGLLCCLLRNNFIYAYVLSAFVFILLNIKQVKGISYFIVSFAITVLLYFLINNFLYPKLNIQDVGSREALCVPMQQIAYTVIKEDDNLSEEEKEQIDIYMPYSSIEELYNPRLADPIKTAFEVKSYQAKDFIKLWVTLFAKYPIDYIDAFLTLNLPYWYPASDTIDCFSQREYIETGIDGCGSLHQVTRESKIPFLYSNYYEKAADYSLFRNIPIIERIFSISIPLWLILFCLFLKSVFPDKDSVLILLISLLFIITFLAGPVSNFRYVFPIFCLYPLYICLMFYKESPKTNEE